MEKIKIKYRTWHKGIPPRHIKLQIPGWAGDSHGHAEGDKPQPWHCPPFVEASTYGLELIYPFDTECRVWNCEGRMVFDGDWDKELSPDGVSFPPFMAFAPGHYGFTSSLDIKCAADHIVRIEPHPRFYTDQTGTVPLAVCGHIQGAWWPKVFFVVFRSPRPGESHIFRKGEPYAQILILPKKVYYEIEPMDATETSKRMLRDQLISKHSKKIAKNDWNDHQGHNFNDKYKILSAIYAKDGEEGVDCYLDSIQQEEVQKEEHVRKKMPRTLIRRK